MLILLPIAILCYAAVLIIICYNLPIMLKIVRKNKNCAWSNITICIQVGMNNSLPIADNMERLFYWSVFINDSKIHCMFSYTMTVQLQYINHLLQFFKNISYYAGIMLNICFWSPIMLKIMLA